MLTFYPCLFLQGRSTQRLRILQKYFQVLCVTLQQFCQYTRHEQGLQCLPP